MVTRQFSLSDAESLRFTTEAQFADGGGSLVAAVLSTVEGKDQTAIVKFGLDGPGEEIWHVAGLRRPRFLCVDPQGRRVAFIADVEGTSQLHLLDTATGGTRCVTDHPHGVVGVPAWCPDGARLAVSALAGPVHDPSSPRRVTRVSYRFDGLGYIDDIVQNIHVVDAVTGDMRQLSHGESVDSDPRWAADGSRLLYRRGFQPSEPWQWRHSVRSVHPNSGVDTELLPADFTLLDVDWLPDDGLGARIVFVGARPSDDDTLALKDDVWILRDGELNPRCLTDSLPAGVGERIEFDWPGRPAEGLMRLDRVTNSVVVSAQRGGSVGICRVPLDPAGAPTFPVSGEGRVCFLLDTHPESGGVAFVSASLTSPPEVHVLRGDVELEVTTFNSWVNEACSAPQVHAMKIPTQDGLELDGWVLAPDAGGPFPTVLYIHGGPAYSFGNVFHIDFWLLCAQGIAVLFSNFRGSAGYGNDFFRALGGDWGGMGEADHHAAVDTAVGLELADPLRLGVAGMSHGGFATCWLLGRSDRFRAGMAENPLVNWLSAYGTIDSPCYWFTNELGDEAFRVVPLAWSRSPLAYAESCRSPMLLVVGEDDFRCRITEAEQFYRVLRAVGCEAEMLRLPGGSHTVSWDGAPRMRAAQNEALVEWFTRHLMAE